jgi:hypothetical protein
MAFALGAALWNAASPAWACPTCSNALEGDPVGLAFYWSTLFMIAMPYLLVSVVGGGVALVYWNAARNAAALSEKTESMWSAEGPEKEGGR